MTEGFQPINNNLPPDFLLTVTVNYSLFIFHSSFRREAPHFARRLSAAKPHIFRAISTENTKPQVLSAAVLPSDEASPEAARLTAAYNLQATRHRKVTSADYRFPTPQCKSATLITHYELRITHFHFPTTASGIQHLISNIKKASSLLQAPKMLFHYCFLFCQLSASIISKASSCGCSASRLSFS